MARFHVAAASLPFWGLRLVLLGLPLNLGPWPALWAQHLQEELSLLTFHGHCVQRTSATAPPAPTRLQYGCARAGLRLSSCGSDCHLDGPLVHISSHLSPALVPAPSATPFYFQAPALGSWSPRVPPLALCLLGQCGTRVRLPHFASMAT